MPGVPGAETDPGAADPSAEIRRPGRVQDRIRRSEGRRARGKGATPKHADRL